MSAVLYRLGRVCYRHRRRVLAAWLGVLAMLGLLTLSVGGRFDDTFHIPNATSAEALKMLSVTFPEAADSSALVVIGAPPGLTLDDPGVKRAIADTLASITTLPYVKGAQTPYDSIVKGQISSDRNYALVRVRVTGTISTFTDAQRAELAATAEGLTTRLPGATVNVGGDAYAVNVPRLSPTEGIGVVIALAILIVTLGGLLGALMPLGSALTGVGIGVTTVMIGAGVISVMSTTLMLVVMLSLAVGVDYALFIISRHRTQLAIGLDPEESAARAVATSGSAVVFAGGTVIIALIGLSIANLPFLTVMGCFTAVGVAVEVLLALTMLPAFLGFAGIRLRPKARREPATAMRPGSESALHRNPRRPPTPLPWSSRMARRWVNLSTRRPLLTVLVIVFGLGALAIPAKDLHLALPTAGQSLPGQRDRVTYDLVGREFGVGANGPLIVTGSIVESTDPLAILDGLTADIEALPGVQMVALATPNANADTALIQVIPTTGPDDVATIELVKLLRAQHDAWLTAYGIDTAVTGFTAVEIDVSQRLSRALLPFGVFVVGLSFILLMVAFRSLWVPVKATLGYLLSIGAAFGTTTLVFNHGYGKALINLAEAGPIISFLPIILMGVLFGLSMDYEVFLTSRMREEYVQGNTDHWIEDGFVHSAKVVAAAGFIMFSVFVCFVPAGTPIIKPIAFSLAVGVLFDAFLVRMTLGPAVMKLMGADGAWGLPRWLDQHLPTLDVEGQALTHQTALADWPSPGDTAAIHAEGLTALARGQALFDNVSLRLEPGQVLVVTGERVARLALAYGLTGRARFSAGDAKVLGRVLPEEAAAVRVKAPVITAVTADIPAELRRAAGGVVVVPAFEDLDPRQCDTIRTALSEGLPDGLDAAWVIGLSPSSDPFTVVPHDFSTLDLDSNSHQGGNS